MLEMPVYILGLAALGVSHANANRPTLHCRPVCACTLGRFRHNNREVHLSDAATYCILIVDYAMSRVHYGVHGTAKLAQAVPNHGVQQLQALLRSQHLQL